jgi:hypothetical protein
MARQPYAINTILLPMLPVPQCLAEPVGCHANFELYHQSTQESDTPLRTAPPSPMLDDDDRKPTSLPAPKRNLCEADRMTIALKNKKQQLKGVDGDLLDAEYTMKKHAVRKNSKVNTWMYLILSKEDIPLCELAVMVHNSYYVGEHGEELKYVLKFISVLRGIRTPGKRYLVNLSLCALCIK